jgi:hypothetical protein
MILGMGINERRLDMLEKRARDVITAKAAREAKRVVGIWNARHAANRDLWFYPTIGAAIAAECPWLRFYCPACRQIGEVDCASLTAIVARRSKVYSGVVVPALQT